MSAAPKPRRGIATIADIRARCEVDLVTHCWHWLGAMSGRKPAPRLHVLDLRVMEKRTISGPLALWMVAHGTVPNGLPFRRCLCFDCMNPAHLRVARDKAEIGRHAALSGKWKGKHVEQKRANLAKARAVSGVFETPVHKVLAIRSAPASVTSTELARSLGLSLQATSRIRRGETRVHVTEAT